MKKLLCISILLLTFSGLYSQGLFSPVTKEVFKSHQTYPKTTYITATPNKLVWLPRWEIGLTGISYELKKGSTPQPLSAICTGISLQSYKLVNDQPFNVWGASLLLLKDTQNENGFGLGLYGTYNTNMVGIVNGGFHYDFVVKNVFADVSLTFHF